MKAKQDELARLVASGQVAEQEKIANQALKQSQLPIVEKLQAEVAKRQDRLAQNQVIRAPKSGVVVTSNLYQLIGKTLQKGEPVLEIADPTQLVAIIEVRQEEADLVKSGAKVTFNPLEPGLKPFTARIHQIETVMTRDEQQQLSKLRVMAVIDHVAHQLKPNAKMYAKIDSTQQIPLYVKCQRELMNLFKVRSL